MSLFFLFQSGNADVTAPILSNPTATVTGLFTATGTVITDEGDQTLYYYASTNSTELAATIKASGSNQIVTATGTQNVSLTGLLAGTTYYLHFVQDDSANNTSNVVSTSAFTTDPVKNIIYAQKRFKTIRARKRKKTL